MKKFISKLAAVTMAGLFLVTPCVYGTRHAKRRSKPARAQTTVRTDTIDPRDRDYNMEEYHKETVATISDERKQEIIATIWRAENDYMTSWKQRNLEAMAICRRLMMTLLNQLPKLDAIRTLLGIQKSRDPEAANNTLQTLSRQGMVLDSSHILLMKHVLTSDNYIALFIWPVYDGQPMLIKF